MRNTHRFSLLVGTMLAILGAVPAAAQQASINLKASGTTLTQYKVTDWSLTKTAEISGTTVTWTVDAVKGSTSNAIIQASGLVTVQNGGSANATIGNIVINLQKKAPKNPKNIPWVSVAADMANSSSGDAATSAKIVKAGSAEDPTVNASLGAGNYTVSGSVGTFKTTAGSGKVSFTDASNNTAFSVTPQLVLAPGATITLLYSAQFNNSVLGLAPGAQLKVESLVTFGNAGNRGNSGASANNVDISGNGTLQTDEKYVRTVPVRYSGNLSAGATIDNSALLTDTIADITTTGTVTFGSWSTSVGLGTGAEVVNGSVTRTVTATIDPGALGGTISNTAHLNSSPTYATLISGTTVYTFLISPGVNLNASATVEIGAPQGQPKVYGTFHQKDWGSDLTTRYRQIGQILLDNFATVYPGGFVEVGIPGASGFSMKFTSGAAAAAYLPVMTFTEGPLTTDLTNPTSSSSQDLGAQVLALQLLIDFENLGLIPGVSPVAPLTIWFSAGDTSLDNTPLTAAQAAALSGKTYADILAEGNTVLGGGPNSLGITIGQLRHLLSRLNESYWKESPSGVPDYTRQPWTLTHVVEPL